MASRSEIVDYISRELRIKDFKDSSMNGLQIEGSSEISKICVAVDSGLEVVRKAVSCNANLLLVHHGLFWGAAEAVTGPRRALLSEALESNLNLVAVHLPLDANEKFGNNFCLARIMGLGELSPWGNHAGEFIGCLGHNVSQKKRSELFAPLLKLAGASDKLHVLEFGPEIPQKIAIISGAGADMMKAQIRDFDTFITGEPRQFAFHYARENYLNAAFIGHYASETIGVIELGKHLADTFKLEFEFVDVPTGI